MATNYRADDEASRRAAAQLGASPQDFSRPAAPTRPAIAPAAPAAPVAARPQVQPGYAAGKSVNRFIAAPTAYSSMGAGYAARSQAMGQVSAPIRGFLRGVFGAEQEAPSQPSAPPSRPAVTQPAQKTPATPAAINPASQVAATQPPAPNQPQSQPPAPNQPPVTAAPGTYRTTDGQEHALPPGVTMTTGPDGVRTVSQSGVVQPNQTPAIGSVASQNFGTVPAATVNYGQRPQVASTFGLSANDPRLNDGNQAPQRPQVSLRGADAMGEAYNATADREARQRLASDLDSERFRLGMIAGEGGNRRSRAAIDALGQNTQQRAALASSAEALSANAIQNRANRDNALANTGLQERGQDFRAQLDAQNRSDIAGMNNATEQQRIAAGITRPMIQGDDGTYYQANNSGGPATVVTGPDGKPIRGAVGQVAGQITPQSVLSSIDANIKAVMDAGATTGQVDQAALDNLTAQRDALIASASGQQANGGAPQTEDAFVQAAVRAGKSEEAARAWWKANRAQGAR